MIFLLFALVIPVEGVSLAASLDKPKYRVGEPIRLRCTLANNSRGDFEYFPSFFYRNHSLVVRDERGKEAQLAEEGERIEKRAKIEGGKNRYMTVKVGETFESLGDGATENDLAKIYRLPRGKYTIKIRYKPIVRYKEPEELTSNEVRFEVK